MKDISQNSRSLIQDSNLGLPELNAGPANFNNTFFQIQLLCINFPVRPVF
jgi:hypothetical protein